jgi:hypothetical protein
MSAVRHREHWARHGDGGHPARLGRRWRSVPDAHERLQILAGGVFLVVSGGIVMGLLLSIAMSLVTAWPVPISVAAIAGGFLFSAMESGLTGCRNGTDTPAAA